MEYKLIDGEIVWTLHATHGFTVDISIPMLADRGLIPTWDRLLLAAQKDGANIQRLASRLEHPVIDGYPQDVAREIVKRLPACVDYVQAGVDGSQDKPGRL